MPPPQPHAAPSVDFSTRQIDSRFTLAQNLPVLMAQSPRRGRLHAVRSVPIGWPALVLVAIGLVWDFFQLRPGGVFNGRPNPHQINTAAAISFAATWVVFILFLMAAWDLAIAFDDEPDDPSLGFGQVKYPPWLQPLLGGARLFVLAAFLLGLMLGHWFWL
jgi:hypothetical protein